MKPFYYSAFTQIAGKKHRFVYMANYCCEKGFLEDIEMWSKKSNGNIIFKPITEDQYKHFKRNK